MEISYNNYENNLTCCHRGRRNPNGLIEMRNKKTQYPVLDINFLLGSKYLQPGRDCSKLTTLVVNVSLKFQMFFQQKI